MQRRPKGTRDYLKAKLAKKLNQHSTLQSKTVTHDAQLPQSILKRHTGSEALRSKLKGEAKARKLKGIHGAKIKVDITPCDLLFKDEDLLSFQIGETDIWWEVPNYHGAPTSQKSKGGDPIIGNPIEIAHRRTDPIQTHHIEAVAAAKGLSSVINKMVPKERRTRIKDITVWFEVNVSVFLQSRILVNELLELDLETFYDSLIEYDRPTALDYALKRGLASSDNFGRYIPSPAELYAWNQHGGSHALPSPVDAAVSAVKSQKVGDEVSVNPSTTSEDPETDIRLSSAKGVSVADFDIQGIDPSQAAYVLVEYCCSETSQLCDHIYKTFSQAEGKSVVRIRCSDRQDMTKAESVESLKK